jgi:nucleoside 2-deoxyribosyltransferase
MKYDYFIAGRWRNHREIRKVLQAIRETDKKVYCFIDNAYDDDNVVIDTALNADVEKFMNDLESIEDWQNNPTFRKIYENDMNGLRNAETFIMVLPAGLSAHMELGVAYGMGKKCYGIGRPEKTETLYLMFEEIFPDTASFLEAKIGVAV